MKTVQYQLITEVAVSHNYYKNGVFRDLQVRPDACTEKVLNEYGFLFNSSEQRFSVYGNESMDESGIDYLANHVTPCFGFELYSQNAWYTNFTQVPFNELSYQEYHNKGLAEGTTALTGVTVTDANMSGKIARVLIYLEELLKGDGFSPGNYAISFSARRCQWNFFIVSPSMPEEANYQVRGIQGEVFDGPRVVQELPGEVTLHFTSGTKQYALKEYPSAYCSLLKDNNSTGAYQLVQQLPAASPRAVTSSGTGDSVNDDFAISSIYIYL